MPQKLTLRRVLGFVSRCDVVEELHALATAVEKRRQTVVDAARAARCRERFEQLATAPVVERDESRESRVFFGETPRLYRCSRWYVRGRHTGRKYVGLWVTKTPDEPRGRTSSVFLPLADALMWKPAGESEQTETLEEAGAAT